MKRLAYILMAAAVVFAACTKEEFEHPTEAGLKNAASYNPTVTVDQELNQVTFSLGETGVVPVWVLQDNDGNWTSYNARDNFRKIFVASGNYAVRMYVMNASGLSPDYVEKTFHIDNTLIDFSKYIKYISGGESRVWRINNAEPAHMACGESVDNPTGWWSAGADEKAAFGVYDNRLTFTSDGAYTFDPGAAGTVYVNVGVTKAPYAESGHDSDYTVPQDKVSSTYEFAVDGNDLKLALPAGTPFPYIPNDDYLSDSRFFLQSLTNKEMVLIWYTATGNGGGPIAWQYILTSSEASVKEDPLYGSGSRIWKMASDQPGHMACGPDAGNPAGWWSAAPGEKADFGVYDNRLTFAADGTYTFDPGEDGLIYVNWGCATVDGQTHSEPDFTLAWQKQEGKYSYDGETITLPANFTVGYIPNDDSYANPVFQITELTDSKMVLVSVTDGIAWQFIFVPEGGSGGPDGPDVPSGYTYGPDLLAGLFLQETWFSPAGWAGGLDPQASFEGGKLTLTVPEGIGGSEWMGQVKLVAPIPADPEKEYAFFATIESSDDCTATVKVADANADADHAFFYDNAVQLSGSTPLSYKNEPIKPDQAYESVMVIFDFGRTPAGAEITVTDIKLCEITGKSGGQEGGGLIEGENLWANAECTMAYWYSGPGWDGALAPAEAEILPGNGLRVVMPEGIGGSEWMGQNSFHLAGVPASKDEEYDFWLTLEADEDMTVTVKLAWEGHDTTNEFFYDNNVKLSASEPLKYVKASISPDMGKEERNDYDGIVLFVDSGRSPAGSELKISDIHFQKHIGGTPDTPDTPTEDYTTNDPSIPGSYYDVEGARNLWRKAQITNDYWYSGPAWDGLLEPVVFKADDWGGLKVIIPEGIGGNEWMGQTKWHTDIPASADATYDFCVTVKSDEDINGLTFKLAWEGNDNDHSLFYVNDAKVKAGVPYTFKMKDLKPDVDYDKIVLFVDLGRCKVGTAVSFTNFCLQKSSSSASYGENLFSGQGTLETWFSPEGWAGGLDPAATYADGKVKLTVPDGIGGSEWMGQVKIHTGIPIDKSKTYDYKATVKADDGGTITAKLTADSDPSGNEFFYDGGIGIEADTPCVIAKTDLTMDIDDQTFMIIFDFGRLPAGTVVEISDIVLREIQ